MGVITIGEGGMVRIPEDLLAQAHLKDGAPVSLHVSENGESVIQADEDIAAGRLIGPMTDKKFTAELERLHRQAG